MGRRTVTPAAREVGATIVAVLLAPGVAAVVATLLAVAAIMMVMLMLVAGPALAKGRPPSGESSRYRPLDSLLSRR